MAQRAAAESHGRRRAAVALRAWAPPIGRPEFWVVQVLVILIAAGHGLLEATEIFWLRPVDFLPVSLFLLPVVYAALNFGLRGALPTGLWCLTLTLPNVFMWHEGVQRFGDLWQAALVVIVGAFIGHRVDREAEARREVERRERERRISQDKYRGLFDSAADGILLIDPSGTIQEANAAAGRLFGLTAADLRGISVDGLNQEIAASWRQRHAGASEGPVKMQTGERSAWIEAVFVDLTSQATQGGTLLQLRDVTLQTERRQMLEGYARQMLAAREEERRQIARELHDGPLQSLVLLVRDLDRVEGGEHPSLIEPLSEARATAEEVSSALRRFSRDLRPSVLDDLGLDAALRSEASRFQERTGIVTRVPGASADIRLPAEVEVALLRICQEALRNVERHSGARRVTVRFVATARGTRLAVEDDGCGLGRLPTPSELVRGGRLGMMGMQERAGSVGGICTIRPRRRAGTVVEVIVPAEPATARS